MSLRQRPVSAESSLADVQEKVVAHANGKGHGIQPPLSATSKLASRLFIFLSALGLSALLFLASNLPSFGAPSPYLDYSAPYVLCSSEPAKVYTVDAKNAPVQCILVYKSYILQTGTLAEVQLHWNNRLKDKDASSELRVRYTPRDRLFLDAHAHILEYGASRQLALEGTKTISETVARVREYILANPDVYSNTSIWIFARWPTAADLDSDPILRDCHAIWVSGKAIDVSLPFPNVVEGGVIVRDEYGHPTGMFLDNAQDIIVQPEPTENDLLRRFSIAVQDAVSLGLTSIHDAGLNPMSLDFFIRQAELNKLPYWGNKTKPIIDAGNGRLTARSVKFLPTGINCLYSGALRTGGAALYEPYADNPSTNGAMRISSEVLHHFIPLFLRDGWQVNVHAIGDRANGIVMDVFEASLNGVNISASRPRLEHAQIMTQADRERLGKLGVIASIQPTHADWFFYSFIQGPERVKNLYAFRSLIDSGARIALGSDFPVESPNPLSGFYAAITRLSPDGKSPHGPGGWFPQERLSRQEALRGMTIDPAYASFTESTLGSLEPGKRADFVILSRDIMSVPFDQILDTKVIATVIDGSPVYGRF
ncbi:amidohydrolase family-domain-containing protein [Mycena sp. CBHHK59/15]|nr:amidohydrolase family-domain-containing protein [Mycena sp. CBHHK59/15]